MLGYPLLDYFINNSILNPVHPILLYFGDLSLDPFLLPVPWTGPLPINLIIELKQQRRTPPRGRHHFYIFLRETVELEVRVYVHLVNRRCDRAPETVNDALPRFNLILLPRPELQLEVRLRHGLLVQVLTQVIVRLSGFQLRVVVESGAVCEGSDTLVLKQMGVAF